MTTSCSTEDDPIPVSMQTDTPKNRRVVEHPLASGRCDCWTRAERREADREYFKKFGVAYKDPTP